MFRIYKPSIFMKHEKLITWHLVLDKIGETIEAMRFDQVFANERSSDTGSLFCFFITINQRISKLVSDGISFPLRKRFSAFLMSPFMMA